MSTFFGLLVFLCIVALVIGMIRPKLILRWGPEERRNRKTLAVVTIAGMILFTFLAAQTQTPEEKAAYQQRQEQERLGKAQKEADNQAKKEAEQRAEAEKKEAEAAKAAAEQVAASEQQKKDIKNFYAQIMSACNGADNAMQKRKDAAQSGDVMGTINAMVAEKDAIGAARSNLQAIPVPDSFNGDDVQKLAEGKQSIVSAMDQRELFIAYMAQFIKGDKSAEQKSKDAIAAADVAMMTGLANIMTVAQGLGVELK